MKIRNLQTLFESELSFWARGGATLMVMSFLYFIQACVLNDNDISLAKYSLIFGLAFSLLAIICFIGAYWFKEEKK